MTAPITIPGQLTVAAVEILALLVMIQLIEPGMPVIACPFVSRIDMRTGKSKSGTENFLAAAANVQFCKEAFQVPTASICFSTDTFAIDGQSASEKALSGALAALAGSDILVGHGCVGGGMGISPVQLIIDDTLTLELKRITGGVRVDEDTLAWEDILETEPGGDFLSRLHTAKYCCEAITPTLFTTNSFEESLTIGKKDLFARALDKYRELKQAMKPRELPLEVLKEMDRIVKQADARLVA